MSDRSSILSNRSSPAPEHIELRPSIVAKKEATSLQVLFRLMNQYTPHMKGSFVLSQSWWDSHAGVSGIHVRLFPNLTIPPLIKVIF